LHLKSLTLRGFKSFASSTTLRFEPGVTCVVGPNGSGKSNVVDALAWVMGEQGAKSLRGGKMEDVIFAGTTSRAPLGRAEVVLTIDNSDGALPIEYSEVTLTRTMFRGGGSEYAINGSSCRLIDVAELLSDSGIGREMHVIVGQGQLETILHATPEDRRGFIEEAAGILKHRKRKEKALRKLDVTEGNLIRLGDLLSEIRRQLKPLGRQAEVARRAAVVQMEARDAKARLLADDVVTMRAAAQQEIADEEALRARRQGIEASLEAAHAAESRLDEQLRSDVVAFGSAQETWFGLTAVRERLLGTGRVAAERVRSDAEAPPDDRALRDPDEMEAESAQVRAEERAIADSVSALQIELEARVAERQRLEAAHLAEERRIAETLRAMADRREGLARLTGQVNALRSRAAAAVDEIGRLESARAEASDRASRAQRGFTSLETQIAGLDAGERGLDAEHEAAALYLADVEERLAKLRLAHQEAERERAALEARTDALDVAIARKDGVAALLAAGDSAPGVLGSVAALLTVQPGYEAAVASALAGAADALAVGDLDSAIGAVQHLKADELGRAGLVLGGGADADPSSRPAPPLDAPPFDAPPFDAVWALDVVEAPASLRDAFRRLLHDTVIVEDLAAARSLVDAQPDVVAVTTDGDLVGPAYVVGGSASTPSMIEVQAALDEARESLARSSAACERRRFDISALAGEHEEARRRVDVALARLHESDASMAAVAEQLGQFGAVARNAKAEAERLAAAIAAAEAARDGDIAGLTELERRLRAAESATTGEPDTRELEALAEQARHARQVELEARLALRTAEERARALRGRADALVEAAVRERQARERALAHRERRRRQAAVAAAVSMAVGRVLERLDTTLVQAAELRSAAQTARSEHEMQLVQARADVRRLEAELAQLTDSVHRDEMLRAEQRLRMEQIGERVAGELGLDLDTLVADYGPDQLVPLRVGAGDESDARETPADEDAGQGEAPGTPYVREEQQRRLRSAERALAELGRVNPLALEEFSALEERHRFLAEQLDDLKRTRRDLLDIVKEVDERVEQVFAAAYADVAREFEATFGRLFPGGEGRLLLTDPGNLLATGVDVEARPAGKKIKRLSLLSGGERSLVAVAFLVALFKARPSPFYILDEVEAALDDTNLGRLLEIYEELRAHSQLVVITHQKRTMEVADALYGVSMRGDGVSTVVSQRLREPVDA
jgi:chromosome segregation protein